MNQNNQEQTKQDWFTQNKKHEALFDKLKAYSLLAAERTNKKPNWVARGRLGQSEAGIQLWGDKNVGRVMQDARQW